MSEIILTGRKTQIKRKQKSNNQSLKIISDDDSVDGVVFLYWSKILTDQPGWYRFFRKHKMAKNLKRVTIKQVIIHLSKLLKFIFRKIHDVTFLVKKWTVPYQNTHLQFYHCWLSRVLDIQNHTFFHWFWMEKSVDFYAPPPESGGVLCYTLRNFECPSVLLSVRPSVHPSVSAHHHSCIGNSSYSFRPILLKLYRCFKDGLKICILFFQNPEIIFYHFFPIFNLDIFQALILQICIWSMYLVSATPPTVFGESFWNFTGVLRMVWRYAYCFFRILKLFFITFFAFLT